MGRLNRILRIWIVMRMTEPQNCSHKLFLRFTDANGQKLSAQIVHQILPTSRVHQCMGENLGGDLRSQRSSQTTNRETGPQLLQLMNQCVGMSKNNRSSCIVHRASCIVNIYFFAVLPFCSIVLTCDAFIF